MTPAEQAIRAALAAGPTPGPWMLETVQTSCGVCHKIGPFPGKQGGSPSRHACMYADYPSVGNPADAELLANARLMAACNPTNLRALLDRLAAREAECERLRSELNDCLNVLPGSAYYMDPPDGGSVTIAEQLRRMGEDAARYRWLRDRATVLHEQVGTPAGVVYPTTWKFRTGVGSSDTDMDAAIDDARSKE